MVTPILDVYDDLSGSILTRLIPDPVDIPPMIKEAGIATSETPDEEFALIMFGPDGGKKRKFACVDPGNTALSILYFMESKNNLPSEMRKVAARNLVDACDRYGMSPPGPLFNEAGDEGGVVFFEEEYVHNAPQKVASTHTVHDISLDSYEDIVKAAEHFDETHMHEHPYRRRELAVGIYKRAAAVGVEVSGDLERYASDTYAPDLGVGIDIRTSLVDDEAKVAYVELYKQASRVDPTSFVKALSEVDVALGLDQHWDSYVPDPYYTTFGKVAEKEFEYTDGVDKITGSDLRILARDKVNLLARYFPSDMVDGFSKNPVVIFKSLPDPHKKTIMRLAQDTTFPGGDAS